MRESRQSIRLRPEFTGRWLDDVSFGPAYELVVSGYQPVLGLRFQPDGVVGWVVLGDEAVGHAHQLRALAELEECKIVPGDGVLLKLARMPDDDTEVKFFAKDASGWWHGFSQRLVGGDGRPRAV